MKDIRLIFLVLILIVYSCDGGSSNAVQSEDNSSEQPTQNDDWLNEIKDLKKRAFNKTKELSEELNEKWKQIEINGFSVDDDIKMGQQLYDEIQNSTEYNVVPRESNSKLYDYIETIKTTILANGNFRYKETFEWKITILNDDKTINAFCAPGGYIFIYTGILKYLDNEAELAGVLAHEMGHAERRHGTRQMTKTMGIQIMLDFLMNGESSDYFKQVIGGLLTLRYSRSYEREADECSVSYLCDTEYKSDGAAGFFEKILNENGEKSNELLSTHPDPEERISTFHSLKKKMNCQGNQKFTERYKSIKKIKLHS